MLKPRLAETRVFFAVSVVFVGLSMAGCGPIQTFDGPRLPNDQVAILTPNSLSAQIGFEVLSVDGRPFKTQDSDLALMPGECVIALELTPNPVHTIDKSPLEAARDEYFDRVGARRVTIVFGAEAGHRYFLQGSMLTAQPTVQVIDRATGRPVPTRIVSR